MRDYIQSPALAADDAAVISENSLHTAVTWKNHKTIPKFDTAIRVRVNRQGIRPEDGMLYAVYVK
jgi:hypothetical protein